MDIGAFDALVHPQHHGNGQRSARCPAHADNVASLSYREGDHGGIVATCHAGCSTLAVVEALGLTLADLMGEPYVEAEYVYTDEEGRELYRVVRWANPKDFRSVNMPEPALRVPYNLPLLRWGIDHGRTVYIVEGEKDVETLRSLKLIGTTVPGGGGPNKFLPHYAIYFTDANVVIVADRDPTGVAHARTVAKLLEPIAASVMLVMPRYGKDVSDLVAAGFGVDALDPLPETDGIGLIRSSNVRVRKVAWAWKGYVPFGMVTGIDGDPGDGKTLLSTDLAARWSTTLPMPDGSEHDGPYNVVMITAEDDPEYTIVPRLMAAGADLKRVFVTTHGVDESKPFDITTDVPELYRLVQQHDVRIITLDPLMAMIGPKTDSHVDSSVRQALYPLYRLASDLNIAVLVIRHMNKNSGAKAIYRGGGSVGIGGAMRAVYSVGRHPEDRERRVLANIKINIARTPTSLAYLIHEGAVGPYVAWQGPVEIEAQEVIDGVAIDREEADDITQFLNTVVENGPMTWHEIVLRGQKESFTEKRMRARRKTSRLVKIVGSEGARSVRWGYLEHQLAAIAAAEQATTKSDDKVPSDPPFAQKARLPYIGQNGETGKREPGQLQTVTSDLTDEERLAALEAMPLVCDQCGSLDAHRWAGWWVIRCLDHNPEDYGRTK